ncbi:MAG: homocysteine S-methyltransferase family protein [Elusimicrobiota bacterium]|nr:homocysteine S-methyltransferase family protein [Elusimicrobiota bacterium]
MNKKEFLDVLKSKVLIMDGATGTMLESKDYLKGVSMPEELNIKFPERISDIYSSYIEAGSDIVLANTFGINPLRLKQHNLSDKEGDDIIKNGISLLKDCAKKASKNIIAAGDISSLGEYINPLGKLSFDEAFEAFSYQASLIAKHGADIIVIETMSEIKELKAAILAAKANFSGAIIAQMTFSQDQMTASGTDLKSFIAIAESLGADAIGLNCSVGSKDLALMVRILIENTNLPISFKPNAGMPVLINKKTVFPESIETFIENSLKAYSYGVNMFGGCCGTNPQYIKALAKELKNAKPCNRKSVSKFFISSRTTAYDLNEIKKPVLIGERINPSGKKKFQEELLKAHFSYAKDAARQQFEAGANILDVNTGLAGADEVFLLVNAVCQVQETVPIALCIDSSNPKALEEAVKNAAGRPLINSVNGEKEKLEKIMPIAQKYDCPLIALATDEKGIPKTTQSRLDIAAKIVNYADKIGFKRQNLIFDYLSLAISAAAGQTQETLNAIKMSKKLYPECSTVLGISNISFGLPSRQILNSTFLKMASEAGLDFAIINPNEDWTIYNEEAQAVLLSQEGALEKYMSYAGVKKPIIEDKTENLSYQEQLYMSVLYGDNNKVSDIVHNIIDKDSDPFKTVNESVLKALNAVGDKFAAKEYFLPQIIMSAQAAQNAFAIIKDYIKNKTVENENIKSAKIILATVKGDMHDIGKNIVGAVLESYGFEIIDLGINVDSKEIIEKAKELNPQIIGLSALMTTTMPEMEIIIKLINTMKLPVKVMIGGAAVTEKFAKEIGAVYAKDAMEAAKTAQSLMK